MQQVGEVNWKIRGREIRLGQKSLVAGILNVTPDSFSDGGKFFATDAAVQHGLEMWCEGARLIDIGGESTRPGFNEVSVEDEVARLLPVIEELLREESQCILSVDTSKSQVARAAVGAGVAIVNDVSGFQADQGMAEVVSELEAGVILMWNGRFDGDDGAICDRIRRSWEKSLDIARTAGIDESAIVLDPGVGFGTTREEDLAILRGLADLRSFGFPLMLGTSRKRITALPIGLSASDRMESTLATSVAGVVAGVEIFRVHDVLPHVRALAMADLIYKGGCFDE